MDGVVPGDIEKGIAAGATNADTVLTVDFQKRNSFENLYRQCAKTLTVVDSRLETLGGTKVETTEVTRLKSLGTVMIKSA
jgi:hypothetical protein